MCMGIPMQITALSGTRATCLDSDGTTCAVDLSLIDGAHIGAHVLVFLGRATEVLDADDAARIQDALKAVALARTGQPFDHLIADLVDRTPVLPPHLASPSKRDVP